MGVAGAGEAVATGVGGGVVAVAAGVGAGVVGVATVVALTPGVDGGTGSAVRAGVALGLGVAVGLGAVVGVDIGTGVKVAGSSEGCLVLGPCFDAARQQGQGRHDHQMKPHWTIPGMTTAAVPHAKPTHFGTP